MSRSRVIFYAVLGLGLLIVGSQAVFASTESTGTTATIATATATVPPDRSWNIAGTIQAMNGEFWNVQGFAIRVTADTRITGDLPTIGSYVRAAGVVQADGTWLTTDLQVGRDSATATPTSAPTDTSTATPTASATPSATATPISNELIVFHPTTPHARPPSVTPVRPEPDADARPNGHGNQDSQDHHRKGSNARDKHDHGDVRPASDQD